MVVANLLQRVALESVSHNGSSISRQRRRGKACSALTLVTPSMRT